MHLRTSFPRGASRPQVLAPVLCLLLQGPPVCAQQTAQPEEAKLLDPVLVTARRQPEDQFKVPLSASVLQAEDMADLGVTGFDKVGQTVPSLNVQRRFGQGSGPSMTLRGQEIGSVSMETNIRAALYLDDVYLGRIGALSAFSLADLCELEVLRGPQGTLFGGNSAGGVIRLGNCAPATTAGGSLKTGFGNYGQREARLSLDSGVMQGFSARLLVQKDRQDGWTRNASPGVVTQLSAPFGTLVSADELGRSSTDALAISASYKPDAHWQLDYRFDTTTTRDTQDAVQLLGLYGGIASQYDPAAGAGGIAAQLTPRDSVPEEFLSPGWRRLTGQALSVEYRWDAGTKLKYILGSHHMNSVGGGNDIDGASLNGSFLTSLGLPTPANQRVCYICSLVNQSVDELSHELRLITRSGNWDWVGGLFSFRDLAHRDGPVFIGAVFDPDAINPVGSLSRFLPSDYSSGSSVDVANQTYAAYAQGSYRLDEAWSFSAGLRRTRDVRRTKTLLGASGPSDRRVAFDYTDGEASALYRVVRFVNAYARLSSAHVAGGIQAGVMFEPESNRSAEIGLKINLPDPALRLNIAAYQNRTTHQQLLQFSSALGAYILDGGTARQKGWEAELEARPSQDLTLRASYGLVLARNDNGLMPLTPKQTLYLGAAYQFPSLAGGIQPTLRADATWNDRAAPGSCAVGQSATSQGCTGVAIPGLTEASAIAAHTDLSSRLRLAGIRLGSQVVGTASFWVRNLLDSRKIQFARDLGNGTVVGTFQDPRTFGAELTVRF